MPDDVLHIDFRVPMAELERGLQYSIYMVKFGLQAAREIEGFDHEHMPGAFIHAEVAQGIPDGEEARIEFSRWIMLSGFRDAHERFMAFLETIRQAQVALLRDGNRQERIEASERERARFHGLSFPNKLDTLTREGAAYDQDLRQMAESINRARNCLTHRLGIVREQDVRASADGLLHVRWRAIQISVVAEGGVRRVLERGSRLLEGEQVQCERAVVDRTYAIGQPVDVSADDFQHICMTLLDFGKSIIGAVQAQARARGGA